MVGKNQAGNEVAALLYPAYKLQFFNQAYTAYEFIHKLSIVFFIIPK